MDENGRGESVCRREAGDRTRSRVVALAVVCLGLLLAPGWAERRTAGQGSMELVRWKQFSYAKDVKQSGAAIAVLDGVNRRGVVVLGDGQFAQLSGRVVHTSAPEGKRYYQGFLIYEFADGGSILAKVDAAGEPGQRQVGTIIFLSGTGRFRGISGRGTISSWMPTPWDMYTEIDAGYSIAAD